LGADCRYHSSDHLFPVRSVGGVVIEMFGEYVPKLGHAVITLFISLIFLSFAAWAKGRLLTVCYVGFWGFFIMTGIIMYMLIVQTNVSAAIRQDEAAAAFGLMLAHPNMTDEKLEILASRFPKLRYRMARGEVRALFESTKVPVKLFKLFMQTSNQKYISPQRDWVTKEMPPHVWEEIYTWLVNNGKIIPDSATGSSSHLWIGNSYQHMMAYWGAGRKLADLNASGAEEAERVARAYDQQHDGFEETV